jgi:AbrB family looped-hinge helix DNA binding protein
MTTRVGAKGEVVIPGPLRDALGLGPGMEVVVTLEGDGLRIEKAVGEEPLEGSLSELDLVGALEGESPATSEELEDTRPVGP